jgi:hypothetical protein
VPHLLHCAGLLSGPALAFVPLALCGVPWARVAGFFQMF